MVGGKVDMSAAQTATNLEKAPLTDVLTQLDVTPTAGLTASEARARIAKYGSNALPDKHVSPWRKVLGYLTGPIAFMIEAAALVSAILGHWDDFAIIASLLVFNAALGFWQDRKAANAWPAPDPAIPWSTVGVVLLYNGVWVFVMSAVRIAVERLASHSTAPALLHRRLVSADVRGLRASG